MNSLGLIIAGLRYLSNISRWLWIASLLFGLWLEMYGFLEGIHHLPTLQTCTGNYRIYSYKIFIRFLCMLLDFHFPISCGQFMRQFLHVQVVYSIPRL